MSAALCARPAPTGVVRDVPIPTLVTVRDPAGEAPGFRTPQIGAQISVREVDGMVLEHKVRLRGGVECMFWPSWVSVHADGLVLPLRPL